MCQIDGCRQRREGGKFDTCYRREGEQVADVVECFCARELVERLDLKKKKTSTANVDTNFPDVVSLKHLPNCVVTRN